MESQFGACAVRLSRQAADGTPAYGNTSGALCIAGGVNKFSHGFEIESGDEIVEKDACGNPVVVFKLDDKTKWATFELTLAKSDDRLPELLGLGQLLGPTNAPVGHTIDAAGGCDPALQSSITLELWRQRKDCQTAMDPPLKRVVLPGCKLTPQGFDSDASVALPVYSGICQVNGKFGNGPWSDLDELVGKENWVYAEVVDDVFCTQPKPFTYTPIPAHTS